MKISAQNTPWMSLGCTLAFLIAMPAIADDTELLLALPDPAQNPKANVMFILDTSGSMSSDETTTDPYDSANTYGGSCADTNLYWTDVDVVPVCDGSERNYIEKNSFHCDFADKQIAGIGTYTGMMVQYREGDDDDDDDRWQYLEPGNNEDPVECQADRGIHGDGTAGEVWAVGAADEDPWTSDPDAELSWGSAPRNLSYTVYDGNYLNWKNSPATVILSRMEIMKQVTTKVLSSVSNMNVGIMRFNSTQGGPVIQAMTDLDSNRQSLIDTIEGLSAGGWTPLSETLYESALFWMGAPAYYGELIAEYATDPAALASTVPEVYAEPALDVCAKSFNIMITDGAPSEDDDGPVVVPTLPDFTATVGRASCNGSGMGHCLDDVAEYLSKIDVNSTLTGTQSVITHTIGFTIDLDILSDTAAASGGQYFLADDVESLTIALLQIVGEINERSLSFSAPAVSVNTFNRTRNLNDLYLTMFGARGKTHWPGNLKKYSIVEGVIVDDNDDPAVDPLTGFFFDSARSTWTVGANDGNDVRLGGAARKLPDPATRILFTNNGSDSNLAGSSNAISTGNAMAFTGADFGLTGASGEPTMDDIIDWMHGVDVRDEDNNAATTVREVMGDPLHSQPAAIVYGGTEASPVSVVYTSTNDGYLHAIDGATGVELWAFVPKQLLSRMTRLYFDPSAKFKQYGLDGNIVPIVADRDGDGIVESADGDFVYIVFGMRRGGSTYFALDVTDKYAPQVLWTRSLTDGGESWSTPVIARMDINDNTLNSDDAVVVIGGGYDVVHDTAGHPATADASGAGIHILDLVSGATLWRGGPDSSATKVFSGMTRAMPNQIRVVDMNGDKFADRMYTSDLGGQIWRFDIKKGEPPASLVDGGVIAQLGAEGLGAPSAADTRRFYTAPDLSIFSDPQQGRRYISISIGSGYRAHPFDLTASERFFSVRDPDVFNQLDQTDYDNYDVVADSDLVEISGQTQVVVSSGMSGWKFTLPANEKVLADSVTFDDEVFFVSFTPDTVANQSCSAGQGTNFLYRISVVNGDPVVNNLDAIAPGDEDTSRREALAQGGIAPSPTILFPSATDANCVGDDCTPPPIMCVGVECTGTGFANNPVRTLWTQDGIN